MSKTVKKAKKTAKRRTRGALATVGILFIGSAMLRVFIGAEAAFARDDPPEDAKDMMQTAAAPAPAYGTSDDDIIALLEALKKREDRVAKREAAIASRMQALSLVEEEAERRLVALEQAEQKLRATLSLAQGAAEEDIVKLTEVYANMKPKQAAALFEEMDPEFASGFIARMRPDAAAAVMAGLSPRVAYTISVILAGRNADVPTE